MPTQTKFKMGSAKVWRMLDVGDFERAALLADELVAEFPNQPQVFALRAHVYYCLRDLEKAETDISRAIEVEGGESHLFFTRGTYHLNGGNIDQAICDFTVAIALCGPYKDESYRETVHFWRAEALMRANRFSEAKEDLDQVGDDQRSWINGLRTKAELLNALRSKL